MRKSIMEIKVVEFYRLSKSSWYFRPPDTVCKIKSLWDLWSFK